MEQAARPLTPQEMLEAARTQVPSISIATVYRNIKSLVESGEVVAVELPGEAARYELPSNRHHHHFHCRSCDRVFEVLNCPGDMKRLAPNGFQVESHELILYGLCADCRSTAQN